MSLLPESCWNKSSKHYSEGAHFSISIYPHNSSWQSYMKSSYEIHRDNERIMMGDTSYEINELKKIFENEIETLKKEKLSPNISIFIKDGKRYH